MGTAPTAHWRFASPALRILSPSGDGDGSCWRPRACACGSGSSRSISARSCCRPRPPSRSLRGPPSGRRSMRFRSASRCGDTQVCVIDGNVRLVPAGAGREMHLPGMNLARDYLGRPDLTAERFVANPSGELGDRMCRTGDRTRWKPSTRLRRRGAHGCLPPDEERVVGPQGAAGADRSCRGP